jgi:hypothetical protein
VRLPSKASDTRQDRSRPISGVSPPRTQSYWLERAAKLPGKAIHVAVVLQHLAGVRRARRVPLDNVTCLRFGITRNAKYRALVCLESAGLISVSRKLGRSPIVTILQGLDAS